MNINAGEINVNVNRLISQQISRIDFFVSLVHHLIRTDVFVFHYFCNYVNEDWNQLCQVITKHPVVALHNGLCNESRLHP